MITECSVLAGQKVIHTWPFELDVGRGGFYGSVKYYFGANHLRRSFLSSFEEESKFRFFLNRIKDPIKCAIDIGTYKGTGTALLAHYADKVITIDKNNYIDKFSFWIEYNVYDKIQSFTVDSEKDKADLIDRFDFDFALIDGDHSLKGVMSDFELVKKCGRVLFHDYYESGSSFDTGSASRLGIVPLVQSLPREELTLAPPFAYWEDKKIVDKVLPDELEAGWQKED